jgi:hypothetical protein
MSGGGFTFKRSTKIMITLLGIACIATGGYMISRAFPFTEVFFSVLWILGGLLLMLLAGIILIMVLLAKSR